MASESQHIKGAFGDNPIVYHLIIDRFTGTADCTAQAEIGTFHGGTFSGILEKIEEGWFERLGVNAILISAPYQQIQGWIPGANGEFKHHAYHGYYALDYTITEPRFGTAEDFKALVAGAHEAGLKVLLDIVLNHPGYPDIDTMQALSIDVVRSGGEHATPADYYDYLDRSSSSAWQAWWGPDWVRCQLPGYPPGGDDDETMLLAGLPDFRTESRSEVALPAFLRHKANTRAVERPHMTVRRYLIEWLAGWVREYGIDGFRCDSARHVELDAWYELKQAAQEAYQAWHVEQGTDGEVAFWMTGEVFGQGVEPSHYFDFGFDNLINFEFQHRVRDTVRLDEVYRHYARVLNGRPGYNVLSYLSSHDTSLYEREDLRYGASALLLAPGGVLIYYGDETARPPGAFTPADPVQATRSDMNWGAYDARLLEHWSRLGKFRARHIALARGTHAKLQDEPYVFGRRDAISGDSVVAAPFAHGAVSLRVGDFFREGELVRDAYSGWCGVVRQGSIALDAAGSVLIERQAQSQRYGSDHQG